MKKNVFYLVVLFAFLTGAVGWAEDPDYGDIPEDAETFSADGTTVGGVLESGDIDWFKFTPAANTLYRVTFTGGLTGGWKTISVYQIDESGTLRATLSDNVNSTNIYVKTFFLEAGDDVYVKVNRDAGIYFFDIEPISQIPPDDYSDECTEATSITVDAAAIGGTLTHNPNGSLEVDWFVFDTEPQHMYQILLTKCDNTEVNFQVFSEDCEYILNSSKNQTVMSWFGEQFKIYVVGNPAYLGTYYTLEVVDLGYFPDDYSNESETAEPIVADGSVIAGELQFDSSYQKDEDWFVFTPTVNTLYQITFTGEVNKPWKNIDIYQIDESGTLRVTLSYNVPTTNIYEKIFFLEEGLDVYIKVSRDPGHYYFDIKPIGHYPPDDYSDDCDEATAITVDAVPLEGTLTHNPNGSLEADWFVFDTEPQHMYQITLTKCDNTEVNFQLFNEDCGNLLNSSKSRTVTSWFGEQYKLYVAGSPAYLGTYYTLEVVDLGLFEDDYPNIWEDAFNIGVDGSVVAGGIQYMSSYHKDEDWFTFTVDEVEDYQFMLTGLPNGYIRLKVFRKDELDVLHNLKDLAVYAGNVLDTTLTLPAGEIYVQMHNTQLVTYELSVTSPEPRCGDFDHPYPPGDFNEDCYVNMTDLALIAANWLDCTDPNPPCTE